jgi:hypothetical protein
MPEALPGRHDLEVEVETPASRQSRLPKAARSRAGANSALQPENPRRVSQGGTDRHPLDAVANVTASVYSGGRIFTQAGAALSAKVEQGGNVTYWGDPVVKSSVRFGGVVVKGTATDVDRPLADLGL